MKKTIAQIADLINENHSVKAKAWEKGDNKRIYLELGYTTKKMRTTSYIYIKGQEVHLFVKVECDSQPYSWCQSQEQEIREMELVQEIIALVAEHYDFPAVEVEPEVVVTAAGEINDLRETVQGYTTEWRSVRVPINRFGKLVTRNRQYLVLQTVNKGNAPRNFTPLSPFDFDACSAEWENGECMMEPHSQPDEYIAYARTRLSVKMSKDN